MVKIRLRRMGTRKKPSYRLVAADSRAPRDGAFLEVLGHYNPLTEPATIVIDQEKALKWLQRGAQPTEIAAKLLTKVGIMDKFRSAESKPEVAAEEPPAPEVVTEPPPKRKPRRKPEAE